MSVIEISNVTDLQKIGNDGGYPLSGSYKLTADIDASATSGWNAGAGFDPIGTPAAPFTGTFDGFGKIISDLYISRSTVDSVGLFGCIGAGATVQYLGMAGANITGKRYVGAITAYNQGTISQCFAKGTVNGVADVVAGPAGNVYPVGTYPVGTYYWRFTGQIASGYGWGTDRYTSDSTCTKMCVHAGVLTNGQTAAIKLNRLTDAGSYTGSTRNGVTTSNWATFTDGSYTLETYTAFGVGGIAGHNAGTITQSYSHVTTSITNGRVGNITGVNEATGVISYCYAKGTVSGAFNKGGMVGVNAGSVTNCYWDKTTTGQTTSEGSDPSYGKLTADMYLEATYSGWDME